MSSHLLISFMVFIPILGALSQAFVPKAPGGGVSGDTVGRWIALASSLAASVVGILLVSGMQAQADVQANAVFPWIGSYYISYDMGIDGLNALMILLASVIFPVLIAAEWNQKIGVRGMMGLLLVLQTAFLGAVCAQDIFLEFFFWGMTALPFYFLIGIWGGEDRERAAFRFMVSSSIGNALVFGALILAYYSMDPPSFSLHELGGGKLAGKTFLVLGQELSVSTVAFSMICAGLALRAPIWPVHGWFTSVAQETPASVLVALSAITVPATAYVFIRLGYTLFPDTIAAAAPAIVAVGVVNLLIGGICAAAQTGLRLLLAFICISELGLALVGLGSLNAAGVVGAIYQLLVFGLALAGFGLFAGLVTERVGHSTFHPSALPATGEHGKTLGGIATKAPATAVVAGLIVVSLLGLPGSGGFVAHSLVVLGSYSAHPMTAVFAAIAFLLATYYLFTMYRFVFLGGSGGATSPEGSAVFADLTLRERVYLLPIVACLLFFGLYPRPLLDLVRPTVLSLLGTK